MSELLLATIGINTGWDAWHEGGEWQMIEITKIKTAVRPRWYVPAVLRLSMVPNDILSTSMAVQQGSALKKELSALPIITLIDGTACCGNELTSLLKCKYVFPPLC